MNIASTQYTLKNKTLEIYLSGCDGACSESCHNKQLWDFNLGNDYRNWLIDIEAKIVDFDLLIENVWILGGEPLLQDKNELLYFVQWLKKFNKKMWLWTRFEIEEIDNELLDVFDYIKCGKYDETKITDDNIQHSIKLATSNQHIWENKKKGINQHGKFNDISKRI